MHWNFHELLLDWEAEKAGYVLKSLDFSIGNPVNPKFLIYAFNVSLCLFKISTFNFPHNLVISEYMINDFWFKSSAIPVVAFSSGLLQVIVVATVCLGSHIRLVILLSICMIVTAS